MTVNRYFYVFCVFDVTVSVMKEGRSICILKSKPASNGYICTCSLLIVQQFCIHCGKKMTGLDNKSIILWLLILIISMQEM